MIHVLFCDSAAGTLRQVLRSRGIADRVVSLAELLDWGWIASERVEDRLRWFEETAGLDWNWLAESRSEFLADVGQAEDQLIWIAPRSAQDQCGFQWFLHQTQAPPSQMIVADQVFEGAWRSEPPLSLGELGLDGMAQLLDASTRGKWDPSRFPLQRWRSLMDDGAVLRIVEDGVVRSAPPDYFDSIILHRCPPEWTKWLHVVGNTMSDASEAGHRVSDIFLRWRLEHLIENGVIEANGELPNWAAPPPANPTLIRLG